MFLFVLIPQKWSIIGPKTSAKSTNCKNYVSLRVFTGKACKYIGIDNLDLSPQLVLNKKEVVLNGVNNQTCSVGHTGFSKEISPVSIDGAHAQKKLIGNFVVG